MSRESQLSTEAGKGVTEMFRLDGKVAVVTGGSSGLGVAFACALAEAGAAVVLGARRAARLAETERLVEARGGRVFARVTDVTEPDDCAALVDAGMAEFGAVDVLVNNAGISDGVPALREDPEEFRRVVDVNLNGAFMMAQACARVMEPGSAIVNVSSVLGLTAGSVPSAAYSASKLGLIGLTRDLAMQWTARKEIRVNALAPGFVSTELTAPLLSNGELNAEILRRTPMARLGEPREMVGGLLFLASEASSFVTGVTLPVDGGWSMH